MLISIISDTHSMHRQIIGLPIKGDVLIHCGDIGGNESIHEYDDFNDWLGGLDFTHKIIVPGNHDRKFQNNPEFYKMITNGIVLINQSIEIEGVKFYGSPWTPMFYNWAFMAYPDQMFEIWKLIPDDTDVLITHGPPHGILDNVINRDINGNPYIHHAGCKHLYNRVMEVKPLIHSYGHLHDGYGTNTIGETTFINAAICNERYRPINAPHTIELEVDFNGGKKVIK